MFKKKLSEFIKTLLVCINIFLFFLMFNLFYDLLIFTDNFFLMFCSAVLSVYIIYYPVKRILKI
jgi:hypothetical protein